MMTRLRLVLALVLLGLAVAMPGKGGQANAEEQGSNTCGEWTDEQYGILHAFNNPQHPGVCYKCEPSVCHGNYITSYCNTQHGNCD